MTHSSKQTSTHSRLHLGYYRNGDSHRSGADVSFSDIVKVFGFRSAEIGNWVTKDEQQIAANLFFDALCDLSDILTVPNEVISLKGTLSISFGKGGRKHSQAHYNSSIRQLALAKNAGGGALAHEWFHAFDHYICDKLFMQSRPHWFASEVWLNNLAEPSKHPLNDLLLTVFEKIFLDEDRVSPSYLMQKSIEIDKSLKAFYYARPQETAARAFERVIQEQAIKNEFLVKGTKKSKEAMLGLYPAGKDLNAIQHAITLYFSCLGKVLSTK